MAKEHYIFPFEDLCAYAKDGRIYNLNSKGNVVRRMNLIGYRYLTIYSTRNKMLKLIIEDNGNIIVE